MQSSASFYFDPPPKGVRFPCFFGRGFCLRLYKQQTRRGRFPPRDDGEYCRFPQNAQTPFSLNESVVTPFPLCFNTPPPFHAHPQVFVSLAMLPPPNWSITAYQVCSFHPILVLMTFPPQCWAKNVKPRYFPPLFPSTAPLSRRYPLSSLLTFESPPSERTRLPREFFLRATIF